MFALGFKFSFSSAMLLLDSLSLPFTCPLLFKLTLNCVSFSLSNLSSSPFLLGLSIVFFPFPLPFPLLFAVGVVVTLFFAVVLLSALWLPLESPLELSKYSTILCEVGSGEIGRSSVLLMVEQSRSTARNIKLHLFYKHY